MRSRSGASGLTTFCEYRKALSNWLVFYQANLPDVSKLGVTQTTIMEPIQHDEFLGAVFDRARFVGSIIALSSEKEFARVLKTAKEAGKPGLLLRSYVERLQSAKIIQRSEKPWISISTVLGVKTRDLDAFNWIAQTEPDDLAIDEFGNLYFSPILTTHVLFTDRRVLQSKIRERNLVVILLALGLMLTMARLFIGISEA